MKFKDILKKKIVIFDGAMGTMLQERGLEAGELPEIYNITKPDVIENIHRLYIEAGADIVTTNTFGANELKLEGSGYSVEEIINSSVKNAKKAANNKFVALDIGPTGQLMQPIGNLSFDKVYDIFKRQVIAGSKAGVDVILIETISDLHEAKAAILAAKENCELPVICTMTFQENGRTLVGTDPITMVNVLQDLGIDAIGLNCSLGPNLLRDIAKEIVTYAKIPVIVQPNAGLPKIVDDKTIYDLSKEEYVCEVMKMVDFGVSIIGGCCGTTQEYIKKLAKSVENLKPKKIENISIRGVSSSTKTVMLDDRIRIVGERINPTGKKKLKEVLKQNSIDYIINEAVRQAECGADILDVNVGLPEIEEKEMMLKIIKELDGVINLPLQIDSSDSKVIEAAVRQYNGKPIINSVNGKQSVMDEIFPIVKKYGAYVIALTLDEKGLPNTCEERIRIVDKIINTAQRYGIEEEKIIVDCLTLTASAQQEGALETLKAVKEVKEKYNVKTTLGTSNISFGLPSRKTVNKAFMTMSLTYGLDLPITDPTEEGVVENIRAFEVLSFKDKESKDYIEYFSNRDTSQKVIVEKKASYDLGEIIVKGLRDEVINKTLEMLKDHEPLDIVNNYLIPSLEIVGEKYEKGEIFLPQLIKSAETVKKSFNTIKDTLKDKEANDIYYGKIILATVKGDIHDIGKNIVKVLLENYGYKVIDLGKDVPIERVVKTAKEENIELIGLSALMTTTVVNMKETIQAVKEEGLECKLMVGGAVLNEEYAKLIQADYYCKDGMESVKVANEVFKKN